MEDYRSGEISFLDLARISGFKSHRKLANYFIENNIKTNRQLSRDSICHDFFEKIDSNDKAYILGFWAADGTMYLNKANNSISKRISISVSLGDIEILNKIKAIICPNNKIYSEKSKSNKEIDSGEMRSFSFISEKMFDDLVNLGFSLRKTYQNFGIPKMGHEFIPHFIRGYFDGDGSVGDYSGIRSNGRKYRNGRVCITSKTELILLNIKDFLNKNRIDCSVMFRSRKIEDRTSECYELIVSGFYNLDKFENLIYNNANLFLNRKFNIFKGMPKNIKKSLGIYNTHNGKYKVIFAHKSKDYYFGVFFNRAEAAELADMKLLEIKGFNCKINFEEKRLEYIEKIKKNQADSSVST